MNILTFDVEEWFHLLDFDATRTEDKWGEYEVRIHDNMERVFRILEDTDTKATSDLWGQKKRGSSRRLLGESYFNKLCGNGQMVDRQWNERKSRNPFLVFFICRMHIR